MKYLFAAVLMGLAILGLFASCQNSPAVGGSAGTSAGSTAESASGHAGVPAGSTAGPSPGAASGNIDPRATDVVKVCCDTLKAAKSMQLTIDAAMDVPAGPGQLVQITRKSTITAQRPDKLFARVAGPRGNFQVWYDGKTLAVLDTAKKQYATRPAPATITEMLDDLATNHGVTMPAADLLVSDPYGSFMARVTSAQYVGVHNVDGHPCHHLAFTAPAIQWQLWVDTGTPAVPRKLVITHVGQPDQPEYAATMDQWNLAPTLDAGTFDFRPPQGAKSVPIADMLASEGE